MNKVINSYAGDSISIRCRIYDEAGSEFDSAAFEIDGVIFTIVGVTNFDGSISGNVVQVWIPEQTLTEIGRYKYYLQIKSQSTKACWTVLAGSINVMGLPE